jgi:predicted dehydrogenase
MIGRALIVGYGSIGARHAHVLEELGLAVAVVSRRGAAEGRLMFSSVAHAFAGGSFNYVVVADETARHADSLAQVARSGHRGCVLVEKPLFAEPAAIPVHRFQRAGVGYNLRFHPAVRALRAALADRAALIADLHVGQWLGDWRPGRVVAATYSATRALGGGALRDLSHELDLATWLFGPWREVAALGGRLGDITVDADDGWGILLACERCPVVSLHLDTLDRAGRRTITVQVDGETLSADLIKGTLKCGHHEQSFPVERDHTYSAMHQALLRGCGDVCSLEEGLCVVRLIAAIENAKRERRWIGHEAT